MIRVAYVCADPGVPVFGDKGASVHVRAICGAFLEDGHELTLFASRRGGEAPRALRDVPVIDLPAPTADDPLQREREAIRANEHISEALAAAGPFDVVYERAALWTVAPTMHAADTGAVGILELNAPLVDEQARYRTLVQTDTAVRLLTTALHTAHLVVAVSDGVAAWARKRAPAANVHVVPNGVDVRRFGPRKRKSSRDDFVIGFVGTLKPWHGLPVLIEAFGAIAPLIPRAHLTIVGDGPERSRIVAGLRRDGLLERATLTGSVAHDDVPALLSTMEVAVAPYPALDDFYFSPLKVAEYMAAGLPVVASRIGQITSLVRHEETGLLFTPGNANELTSAVRRLYEDPELRHVLGAAAQKLVAERCTWTRVLDRILSLADLKPPVRPDAVPAKHPVSVAVHRAKKGWRR